MWKHAFNPKYLVSKFFILIPLNDRVLFDEVNLSKKIAIWKQKQAKFCNLKMIGIKKLLHLGTLSQNQA